VRLGLVEKKGREELGTCSSVTVSLSDAEEAEVSVSAGLLSVDLRRHSQLRRSILRLRYTTQCRSLRARLLSSLLQRPPEELMIALENQKGQKFSQTFKDNQ